MSACADRCQAHWREAHAGVQERAAAIRLRGLGHKLQRDFSAAIDAHREAVELWRTLGYETKGLAMGLNSLATAKRDSGDLEGAERDYHEARRIAKFIDYPEGIASYTGNLAALAADQANLPGAEALAHEALLLSEEIGRLDLIGSTAIV